MGGVCVEGVVRGAARESAAVGQLVETHPLLSRKLGGGPSSPYPNTRCAVRHRVTQVGTHLLLVGHKLGGRRLLQGAREARDGVVVGAALRARVVSGGVSGRGRRRLAAERPAAQLACPRIRQLRG